MVDNLSAGGTNSLYSTCAMRKGLLLALLPGIALCSLRGHGHGDSTCGPFVRLVGGASKDGGITHASAVGFHFHDPGARCADSCKASSTHTIFQWWLARPAAAEWVGKPFDDKMPGSYNRR